MCTAADGTVAAKLVATGGGRKEGTLRPHARFSSFLPNSIAAARLAGTIAAAGWWRSRPPLVQLALAPRWKSTLASFGQE